MDELPNNLRQEIVLSVYSNKKEKVNIFKMDLDYTAEILEVTNILKLNKDEILYREEDPANEIFIVV